MDKPKPKTKEDSPAPSVDRHRIFYADILRIVATIAVVTLHTSAPLLYEFNSISHSWWWVSNVVDSCCRWAVPVFLILSGMLLLDPSKDEPLSVFFKKRFNKVLLPLIIWSILYYGWETNLIFNRGEVFSVSRFFTQFFEGQIYYHLGFLYYLIGLYLITPLLRVYLRGATLSNILYFAILWFVATPIYGLVDKFLHVQIVVELQFTTGYIGYFILGYVLQHKVAINSKYRKITYILGILSLATTILGTYYITKAHGGVLDAYFYEYLSLNVIILSLAIFMASMNIKKPVESPRSRMLVSRIGTLSSATLGVYLIHPLIIELLGNAKITATLFHPLLGIPLTASLVIVISFAVIIPLQKIPIIKRIVP